MNARVICYAKTNYEVVQQLWPVHTDTRARACVCMWVGVSVCV